MKNYLSGAACFALATLIFAPAAQARTCSGAGDLIGSYGFVGSRSLFAGASVLPPGSTGATLPATPVGQLVTGAVATSPFSTVGVIGFDGAGNLLASTGNGTPNIVAGSYSVNTDCSISGTINNVFGAGTTVITSDTVASASFQGVIVDRGNEIDLWQTSSGSGTVITMKRTIGASGCTTGNLSGNYGFVTVGNTLATASGAASPALTSSIVAGRLFADGSGNLMLDGPGSSSPLSAAQITGSYTVNGDCTGTARLALSGGQVRNINFVLVNESACTINGSGPQELDFAFTDPGFTGIGVAKQQ